MEKEVGPWLVDYFMKGNASLQVSLERLFFSLCFSPAFVNAEGNGRYNIDKEFVGIKNCSLPIRIGIFKRNAFNQLKPHFQSEAYSKYGNEKSKCMDGNGGYFNVFHGIWEMITSRKIEKKSVK